MVGDGIICDQKNHRFVSKAVRFAPQWSGSCHLNVKEVKVWYKSDYDELTYFCNALLLYWNN